MITRRLSRLLKAKIEQKKSLEELIEQYKQEVADFGFSSLSQFLDELLIFLERYGRSIDKEEVLRLFEPEIEETIPKAAITIPLIAEKIRERSSLNATFGASDIKAIEALKERMLWVGRDSKARTEERLKGILQEVYKGKYTHDELMSKVREEFSEWSALEAHKLKSAIDFNLRQGSNLGVVRSALELDFTHVQVVAKIDEKTTNICRSMHMRVIPIEHAKSQYDLIVNAKNIGDAKAASDLGLERKGAWSKNLPKNLAIPPYHFGCRTFLRPMSPLQVKEMRLDEFGREYVVDKEARSKISTKDDHLKGSRYKSVDELLNATLGDIAKEGVHKRDGTKRVILGRNGFMVFIVRMAILKRFLRRLGTATMKIMRCLSIMTS